VLDEMTGRLHDLDEVVRRHVRGHADRDAARAVDEEVRDRRGQHLGLLVAVVVVRNEVDDVLVEVLRHRHRGRREPRLGVAGGGGAVVERAEVAVSVDERHAQRERLGEAHEGVVDGRVAVRMELAHDLADDSSRLDVAAIGPQAHVAHHVEDAALHGLEPVTGVGKRT
jgi:hypothetical protein